MNERMRFNPAEEASAGEADARSLLHELEVLFDDTDGVCSAGLLSDALSEIVGLAAENRIEECTARLGAFCSIAGPALHQAAIASEQLEALRAKCALLSASLVQAEAQRDVVESEGGEL